MIIKLACMCAHSCPVLLNLMNLAGQDPLSMGFFQARILECIAIPPCQGIFPIQLSNPHPLHFPALAGRFFTNEPPGKT